MIKNKLMRLIDLIENTFSIKKGDLMRPVRYKEAAKARHILAFILRNEGYSWTRVGRTLNQDHTTAIHGYNRVKNDEVLLEIAKEIRLNIGNLTEVSEYKGVAYWGKWKAVFDLYEAKCQICNEEDIVEIHHKLPIRNGGGNEITNLMILCPTCHKKIHLGLVKIKNVPPLVPVDKSSY